MPSPILYRQGLRYVNLLVYSDQKKKRNYEFLRNFQVSQVTLAVTTLGSLSSHNGNEKENVTWK